MGWRARTWSAVGARGSTGRWWLPIAVALVLVAGACGSSDDSAAGADDGAGGVGSGTADAPAGEDGTAVPSGVVRSSPSVSLITLDPHNFIGGGLSWLTPVYESLFRQVLGHEDEIEPLLASGYEVDGLTVTITLREDVTFSDGEPFDAEAVVANLERGKEVGVRPELGVIDSVAVVDDHTVEVTLAREAPGFISDLASVAGMMISPAALGDPALDRNPVGTGPWVYDHDSSVEGEVHVYTLNPSYWDPAAQGVERLEIYDIPDEQARINALKTGQLDIIVVGGAGAAEIEADPSLGLIQKGYSASFGVPILDRAGTVVEAFASPEVRRAMSLAVDREAFVQAVGFGRGVATIQPAPPGHWAHNDALDDEITYDPDQARQLLADAGYPDGFSFTMPSIPPFATSIEVLGEFWRDIGIEVEVEALEPGTLAGRSRTTDFPATMLNWGTGTDMSLYVPTYLATDATFNPFGVEPDPRILDLATEGAASTDVAERAPAYQEMAEVIAEDLPVIYIASVEALLGTTAELADNPTLRYDAGQSEAPIWHGLRLDR